MVLTETKAALAAKAIGLDFEGARYTLGDFIGGLKAWETSYQKGCRAKSDKTEYKTLKFDLVGFDEEMGIFTGYAAVSGNLDMGGDIIEPGAFTKTIAEGVGRVKILALHNDCELPIGVPLELREDLHGLYIKGKVSDTSKGKDVKTLLRDGVLTELSIGYDPIVFDYDETGIRHLREVKLWEVSVVTWAMNPQAVITDYKSMAEGISKELKEGRKISAVRLASLQDTCERMESAAKALKSVIAKAAEDDEKAKPPLKESKKAHSIKIIF